MVRTRGLFLVDAAGQDVMRMELGPDNRGTVRRLRFGFLSDSPAEIEVEPGPLSYRRGAIASQFMVWGPPTASGLGRQRFEYTLAIAPDGTTQVTLGSTTNGGQGSASLCLNVGEGESYICLHGDRDVELQDRVAGKQVRLPLADLIGRLK